MRRLGFALLLISSLVAGCNRGAQATAEARPARPKPAAKAAKKAEKAEKAEAKATPESAEHAEGPRKFVVPFAWEASRDEPLAQARSYLKEILGDNRVYMEHGPKFFAQFADGQKPRATVVTCADSRVHTSAFDATPENDDFMIRNIGNQIENGLGSVEYGVDHLETPVLMIMGHTGCGAVKAALGDISTQSEPVRKELEKLHISKPKGDAKSDAAWTEAVVENVHSQVAFALTHFGTRVSEGKLTVVGAVYDFRNDLGKGSGKITIVDVNGNGEPARMEAFVEAIESDGTLRKKDRDPRGKRRETGLPTSPAEIISPELQNAINRANEISGGRQAPAPAKPPAEAAPAAHGH